MKSKKLTTLALTGALALGGLGIGSMADLPGLSAITTEAAERMNVDSAKINVVAPVLNAVNVEGWAQSEQQELNDLYTQHNARFTIQNSSGVIVKTGSLNKWGARSDFGLGYAFNFSNDTNISLAGLPKNNSHYRIKMTIPMADGTLTDANFSAMSKAFTYTADGSVINIRD